MYFWMFWMTKSVHHHFFSSHHFVRFPASRGNQYSASELVFSSLKLVESSTNFLQHHYNNSLIYNRSLSLFLFTFYWQRKNIFVSLTKNACPAARFQCTLVYSFSYSFITNLWRIFHVLQSSILVLLHYLRKRFLFLLK